MKTSGRKVAYVTREIERALGIEPNPDYIIISNKTPYGETIQKKYPDSVILIESPSGDLLGTTELLNHPKTQAILSGNKAKQDPAPSTADAIQNSEYAIIVFKNTLRVETAVMANHWLLLNPKSLLSEKVENKISQIRWLGDIGTRYLPPHAVRVCKSILWKNDPFVIQWSHGHTGDGTILVKTREELSALQEKFPERMARLMTFVSGPSFTVNAVVTPTRVLCGNVSYQITGMMPFTDNQFSTIGNDWGVTNKILKPNELKAIEDITQEIGRKLQADGWRGLFGVDFIRDDSRQKITLIEINARQPASTTFESFLQEKARANGARGLTTFEAHIRALLNMPIDQDIIKIPDGAQIVQRLTKTTQGVFDDVCGSLELAGYNVVSYQNTAPNSDLIRVQSNVSIMDSHASFNDKGREILNAIKSSQFKIQI